MTLSSWIEAEKACTNALGQHRSSKGYYRRARARRMLNRTEDAIKGTQDHSYDLWRHACDLLFNKDLRSVLKLQPTNNEAMAELGSLLPPDTSRPILHSNPNPKPKTQGLSPSVPTQTPSSSSYCHPGSVNGSIRGPGPGIGEEKPPLKAKTKPSKQQPFVRTRADERKLRIVLIPATTAEMALEEPGAATPGATRHHHSHDNGDMEGKGKDKEKVNSDAYGSGNRKGKAIRNSSAIGKEAGKSKWREMEEIVRSETVVYPSWDRYIIRMD